MLYCGSCIARLNLITLASLNNVSSSYLLQKRIFITVDLKIFRVKFYNHKQQSWICVIQKIIIWYFFIIALFTKSSVLLIPQTKIKFNISGKRNILIYLYLKTISFIYNMAFFFLIINIRKYWILLFINIFTFTILYNVCVLPVILWYKIFQKLKLYKNKSMMILFCFNTYTSAVRLVTWGGQIEL